MDKHKIAELIEKKDYSSAKSLILNDLDKFEDDIEVQKYLGLCNINLGDLKNAEVCFQKAINLDNNDALSLYYISILKIENGNFQDAENILKNVINLRSEYLDAYKTLAVCYLKQNKFSEVVNLADKMYSINEDDLQIYELAASAYMELHKYDDAEEWIKKAVAKAPENYRYYNKLGVIYLAQNEIDKAIDCYNKAVDLTEDNAVIFYNLGMSYMIKGEFKKSEEFFKRAVDKETNEIYLNSYGMAALKSGDYTEAINTFLKLTNQYPRKENYNYNLACAYDLAEEYDKASEIIEKLITFNSSSVQLKLHLAALYIKRGMLQTARILYADIINSGYAKPQIIYEYAVLCAKTNETDKAESIFKNIIEENPDFAQAYKDLAIIYFSRKFFDRAEENFKKAYEFDSENIQIIYEYANYYYLMSEFQKAENLFDKLLTKEKIPVYMKVKAALNRISQNKIEQAKELLMQAVREEPKNKEALFNLARIYYLEKSYELAKQLSEDVYSMSADTETANLLGSIYYELGQYNDALVLFSLVNLSKPDNISVIMNIAKCQYKLQNYKSAKENIDTVLKVVPEYEDALELLKLTEKEIK